MRADWAQEAGAVAFAREAARNAFRRHLGHLVEVHQDPYTRVEREGGRPRRYARIDQVFANVHPSSLSDCPAVAVVLGCLEKDWVVSDQVAVLFRFPEVSGREECGRR
eukprot:10326318-Alexandrium_andersonii.AAC.1